MERVPAVLGASISCLQTSKAVLSCCVKRCASACAVWLCCANHCSVVLCRAQGCAELLCDVLCQVLCCASSCAVLLCCANHCAVVLCRAHCCADFLACCAVLCSVVWLQVQRPGVVEAIGRDTYILRGLAAVARKQAKLNTDLPALVDEWASR